MTKSKSSSEVNHLRGVIKKLKKDLKRSSKQKNREYEEAKEIESLLEEEMEERQTLSKLLCPKCSGKLDAIGGSKIKVYVCQDCDYRASKKT